MPFTFQNGEFIGETGVCMSVNLPCSQTPDGTLGKGACVLTSALSQISPAVWTPAAAVVQSSSALDSGPDGTACLPGY